METIRALELRHSVRSYTTQPLSGDLLTTLEMLVAEVNREGGLHIQLIRNQPKAFDSFIAHIGKFKNVNNYFALVAKTGKDEAIGYYGQKLCLEMQKLGLNTCWVAGTFRRDKSAYDVGRGEKLYAVMTVGYGKTQGHPASSKPLENYLVGNPNDLPAWFVAGVEAARLAPSAMNEKKFQFSLLDNGTVELKTGVGPMVQIDKGIEKYHFEVAAAAHGKTDIRWK